MDLLAHTITDKQTYTAVYEYTKTKNTGTLTQKHVDKIFRSGW